MTAGSSKLRFAGLLPALLLGLAFLFLGSGADAAKVEVCHHPPGNPDKVKRISVGEKAAAKHLAKHPDKVCDRIDNDCDKFIDDVDTDCSE